jgi:predicted PurR-regulated permease PerM
MSKNRAARYSRLAHEINQSVTGYAAGNLLTSLIAGVVIFAALAALGVPFPLLWALWVALVDFLPMVGGALAGIPTVLFALGHSLTAGIVTAVVFIAYQQLENHVLNPVIMSRTVKVNPLLVLLSILVGSSIGAWLGGLFGGFVAALLSIPGAAALQVIVRDLWQATAPGGLLDDEPEPDTAPPGGASPASTPSASTPPASVPPASVPPASAPPGSAPPGRVPSGRGSDGGPEDRRA